MVTPDVPAIRLCCYLETESIGGMEMSTATLLANLGPRYEVTVLGVSAPVVAYVVGQAAGVGTRLVPPVRHKSNLGAIAAHVNAVRDLRPDLLLVCLSQLYSAQYALLAAAMNRVPTDAVVHCVLPSTSRSQNQIFRMLSRRVRAFGGVSRSVCTATEAELGLRPGSVTLLYTGVPSVTGAGGDPPLGGTQRERFAIGAVGRLVPEKGFDVLVRALAGLPEADLVLMGDGPERAGLEDLGRELGVLDRMTFTGWVEPPWVAQRRCDVLAVPSRVEGFGLVAVEALLAGIPVVASRVGGLTEVVEDGVTGLLVPSDDPEALAGALRQLEGDSVLRAELAERGRADARRRFSVDAMMAAYDRFLVT